jgi:hypothetical protein
MGRTMGGHLPAEENLRTFRRHFHGCMRRRADALAPLLGTQGLISPRGNRLRRSPPQLSICKPLRDG